MAWRSSGVRPVKPSWDLAQGVVCGTHCGVDVQADMMWLIAGGGHLRFMNDLAKARAAE